MSTIRLLKIGAVLVGAGLFTSPVRSQTELEGGKLRAISCNTDGTYTCSTEACLGYCCP